jgi:chemotaxis response regulator CheB
VTIAQDQKSSIVFGMPKIAILNKNIQIVRSLENLASTIKKIVINNTL